jgi:predicted metal-dependent hydrolase
MLKDPRTGNIQDIEFKVIYSRRRTLGISVLPDSSVIVRVPFRTSDKTITRIVREKASWIIKHRDSYNKLGQNKIKRLYVNGETHLFRGNESVLKIEKSKKPYCRFYDGIIGIGLDKTDDSAAIKRLIYMGYKTEAQIVFPILFNTAIQKYQSENFAPSGLIIRSMKRRWGSCSNRGVVTLSTELIKLPDHYIEYVIVHELCHLKHHNHSAIYYTLLTELYPEWKIVRKELRKYIVQ